MATIHAFGDRQALGREPVGSAASVKPTTFCCEANETQESHAPTTTATDREIMTIGVQKPRSGNTS